MLRRRYINPKKEDYYNNYMTIQPLEDNCSVYCAMTKLKYTTNGRQWFSLYSNTTLFLQKGLLYSFKSSLTAGEQVLNIAISGTHNLLGNCLSLIFGDEAYGKTDISEYPFVFSSLFNNNVSLQYVAPNFLPATTLADYCYNSMFKGCTNLTTVPELPATALSNYCYYSMFNGCTSLTTAPELPATTLSDRCYYQMFYNCSSLTRAPELPATTLTEGCYQYMFFNCSKLNYIKMLATDISAIDCLSAWVYGVSSTGTFVKNPNMTTLPTGDSGIPEGWTVVNDGEENGGA